MNLTNYLTPSENSSGMKGVFASTNVTADVNQVIVCTSGTLTVTLPASPEDTARVQVAMTLGVSGVTVAAGSGDTIEADSTFIMDIEMGAMEFIYNGTTKIWSVIKPIFPVVFTDKTAGDQGALSLLVQETAPVNPTEPTIWIKPETSV